jgi:hypothetical protein
MGDLIDRPAVRYGLRFTRSICLGGREVDTWTETGVTILDERQVIREVREADQEVLSPQE